MKSFKQHLTEHSGGVYFQQWQDQDTMPSSEHAIEALNSYVGQMENHEYLNPKIGIEILQTQLGKLGYHFESPTLDGGDGEYSMPLSYGNGTFQADYDENSYGEFKEGDGISDHIEGGVSLKIEVMKSGTGKSIMTAEIVRNAEQG